MKVGVINVWTQNVPFNYAHDVILTSQMVSLPFNLTSGRIKGNQS